MPSSLMEPNLFWRFDSATASFMAHERDQSSPGEKMNQQEKKKISSFFSAEIVSRERSRAREESKPGPWKENLSIERDP